MKLTLNSIISHPLVTYHPYNIYPYRKCLGRRKNILNFTYLLSQDILKKYVFFKKLSFINVILS